MLPPNLNELSYGLRAEALRAYFTKAAHDGYLEEATCFAKSIFERFQVFDDGGVMYVHFRHAKIRFVWVKHQRQFSYEFVTGDPDAR